MSRESIFQPDGRPRPGTEDEIFEEEITQCALEGIGMLIDKREQYGESWKRRGGVGAFMMLVRKADRIEHAARQNGWDVFAACERDRDLIDDIRDLRNYLTLVEHEIGKRHAK
jgi:hypothetical protein